MGPADGAIGLRALWPGLQHDPGERYGMLRRIVNRYNREVNGYFLCDRGRYGYEFVNSEGRHARLTRVKQRSTGRRRRRSDVWAPLAPGRKQSGSARHALRSRLTFFYARWLVPSAFTPAFRTGITVGFECIEILRAGPAHSPSLHEVELSDAVLILGEDVTNIAPRMALSLRQSVRQQPLQIAARCKFPPGTIMRSARRYRMRKGPLFIATPAATRLDDIATETYRAAPETLRGSDLPWPMLWTQAPAVPDLTSE